MNTLSMPLLEQSLGRQRRDENTVILHINHCMDNSFYVSSLLRTVYHDVIFVAVPYSEKQPPADFNCISYHAEPTASGYRLLRAGRELATETVDFNGVMRRLIALALENDMLAYAEAGKQIIIIEDGGYHYDMIADCFARHPVLRSAVIGVVEQTTSGTKASYAAQPGCYPVLSVSRSKYKIRFEAYFVANRVIDGLGRLLHELNDFVDFKNLLILGYGIIGRSVALGLAGRHVELCVSDPNERVLRTAVNDGFAAWDGRFPEHMIVVGNSGKRSFTRAMLNSFLSSDARRILLASSSSKQTEFADILPYLFRECTGEVCGHSTVYRTPGGKEIILLGDGYPLNFVDQSCDSLTFDMIDPVFTEIYLLAEYLRQNHRYLEKRTHLLGNDEALDAAIDEAALIHRWAALNGLSWNSPDFNVHPNESELIHVGGET